MPVCHWRDPLFFWFLLFSTPLPHMPTTIQPQSIPPQQSIKNLLCLHCWRGRGKEGGVGVVHSDNCIDQIARQMDRNTCHWMDRNIHPYNIHLRSSHTIHYHHMPHATCHMSDERQFDCLCVCCDIPRTRIDTIITRTL